ncbi:endonuclease [Legionella sp. PATHC035]|uniref:endonuclease n=1 Tax=Legionella sp. PATHC035 TaxID=2992040 RepID=UPI0022447F31|nr:endonuclease [Legionella sp. PATHC035]MCW8410484.1 endonuclease [Legionella sp. PATHC035]
MFRIALLLCFISSFVYAQTPESFSESKIIAAQFLMKHHETIYFPCTNGDKKVGLASCGMPAEDSMKHAFCIQWKHVMAAEYFGRPFEYWREPMMEEDHRRPYKGRRCCEKFDEQLPHVEADLYNLWPEIRMMNQAHSNYQLSGLHQQIDYLGCAMKIDKGSHCAVPPDSAKGVVARTFLFMAEHYGLTLSPSQKKLFIAWNKAFKPNLWEKQLALQVALIEGYQSSYMTHWQVKAHIAL